MRPPEPRDLSPQAVNPAGRLKVLPAAFWATTTPAERFAFGTRHGFYNFPTTELVARLKEIIGGRKAIEIGAGHGQLAHALGIPGTDSKEQDSPAYKLIFGLRGQRTVTYGPSVVAMDAATAIRHYRPQVVIGCWVTQDHDGKDWTPGSGKLNGVDEGDVLANCETYVMIGNEDIHKDKRIWALPHTIVYPHYVVSRAVNGSRDFIAVWPGAHATLDDLANDYYALTEDDSDRTAAA